MNPRVLFIYSTVDGHTLEICKRLAHTLETGGCRATLQELTPSTSTDPAAFDAVVIGASVRYGKHRPEVREFIDSHCTDLESMPSAFFSVNAVARKLGKRSPETNVYVRKFLESIAWKPAKIGIFAGKIDYPRYGFFDKHMIRLIMWITNGPTDLNGTYEFTDWTDVDAFARDVEMLTSEQED